MTTIKPGTRCECPCWKDSTSAGHRHHYDTSTGRTTPNCQSDAVRMVTPKGPHVYVGVNPDGAYMTKASRVPMCSACADYHESKAGVR